MSIASRAPTDPLPPCRGSVPAVVMLACTTVESFADAEGAGGGEAARPLSQIPIAEAASAVDAIVIDPADASTAVLFYHGVGSCQGREGLVSRGVCCCDHPVCARDHVEGSPDTFPTVGRHALALSILASLGQAATMVCARRTLRPTSQESVCVTRSRVATSNASQSESTASKLERATLARAARQ